MAATRDLTVDERAFLARADKDIEGEDRRLVVRASVLEDWLRQAVPAGPMRHLQVTGPLALTGLTGGALGFEDCTFDSLLTLDDAQLTDLRMTRCTAPTVTARNAAIAHLRFDHLDLAGHLDLEGLRAEDVQLRQSKVRGAVSLGGAAIRGDLLLRGGRIGSGKQALNGEHAQVGRCLRFESVLADGAVTLTAAHIDRLLVARAARLGPFRLDRAVIGDLEVEPGATLAGLSADNLLVQGRLIISGTLSPVQPDAAIDLAGLRVAGDMAFGRAFVGEGPVRLSRSEIAGALIFQGELSAPDANALDLSRLTCGRLELTFERFRGGLSIRQSSCSGLVLRGDYRCPPDLPLHLGIVCAGRTALGEAGGRTSITGVLSLIGHRCQELMLKGLEIHSHPTGRWAGVALAGRHLAVETYLRFGQNAGAEDVLLHGVAALDHARLGDDVRFAGARIFAPEHSAIGAPAGLSMRKAVLRGDLDFGDTGKGLSVVGGADLAGILVDGDLRLAGLTLEAAARLDLSGAAVAGALVVPGLALAADCDVDLDDAHVARLDDAHGAAWSVAKAVSLQIAGFRYDQLGDLTQGRSRQSFDAVRRRLAWIETHAIAASERGEGFSPQPYRTLVAALVAAGHDDGAKRTELAARRQQRRRGSASLPYRLGGALLELTSGYGYAPSRAAIALLIYFLIGWAGVSLADLNGVFETSPFIDGSILAVTAVASPKGCPWLDPPLYALDLMVPLTTLGNENFCSIRTGSEIWTWAAVGYRLFGWIILSIAILTFSGVMKREI